MMRIVARLSVVVALLGQPFSVAAQSARNAAVAIIPAKGKGGPRLDPQLKLLEPSIKAQATVVSFKAYQKAARKLRIKPKDLAVVENACAVGRDLHLSHVVIVQGATNKVGEGRAKKMVSSATVSVVAVESGETIFTQNYVLRGKKLTSDVAEQIARDVLPRIAPPPPPPAPVAEPAIEPPPPPPALEPAPPAAEPPPPAPQPEPVAAPEPAPAPAPEPMPAPPPPPSRQKWRPALTLRLGALSSYRSGRIRDNTPTKALTYDLGGGIPRPLPMAQLEFFPLALGGDGSWYEGIGLEGEGIYGNTVTQISTTPKTDTTSTVVGASGGLALRFVLWNSDTAADFKLRGGYGLFRFPLAAGNFPGVRYSGLYAGGTLTLPIVHAVQLVLSGRYEPKVTIAGHATTIGTSVSSASAMHGEGGLRFVFGIVEIGLMGRYDRYSARFTGTSTLQNSSQYTAASFTDTYAGGELTLGVRL
jgi:hypothetical protein